jgi:hypothetical protein
MYENTLKLKLTVCTSASLSGILSNSVLEYRTKNTKQWSLSNDLWCSMYIAQFDLVHIHDHALFIDVRKGYWFMHIIKVILALVSVIGDEKLFTKKWIQQVPQC